jgi:FKBP-type peptidyl-prolyl cis-trans isomerase
MNLRTLLLSASVLSLVACGSKKSADSADIKLETQAQKLSYAIGKDVGNNLKSQSIEVDPNIFIRGLKEGLEGSQNPLLSDAEIQQVFAEFQRSKMEESQKGAEIEYAKYKAEGEAFLTNNRSNTKIKQTASGLQYEIIKEGNGKTPNANSMVTVHYQGTLLDGTKFDSSYDRGEPATFSLSQVIRGWTEGLQLLKEGGKAKLFIPTELAYDRNPMPGGLIKPGMALIFEVELIKVD